MNDGARAFPHKRNVDRGPVGGVGHGALGPAKASVAHYLRALSTATLAIIVLGETLEPFHLVAFVLVIIGVLLMSRGHTPARRTTTP